jgi:dTDP-4-dehydrorhamnose 3,5-epimerase
VSTKKEFQATETTLHGSLLLEPRVFEDDRGFLFTSYHERSMAAIGIHAHFVQDNHSYSRRNVLRGLHYQISHPQAKLIWVVTGEIFDVTVDLRRSSPTFGKWFGVKLSGENRNVLWVPAGFAHGFYVVSQGAHVIYKATDFYKPEFERTIAWDDKDLAIEWQLQSPPIVSERDQRGIRFKDAETFA